MAKVIACVMACVAVWARPSAAQTGQAYIGASLARYAVRADFVEGSSAAVGVLGGVRVTPWMDVEVDVRQPFDRFDRSYTGTSISFEPQRPGATREEIEAAFVLTRFDAERRVGPVTSVAAIFHPSRPGRVAPRLAAGLTWTPVDDVRTLTHLRLPPGVSLQQVEAAMQSPERRQRVVSTLMFGGGISVALHQRARILFGLRYDWSGPADELDNAAQADLAVAWTVW